MFYFIFSAALKDSYDELQASSIAKGIERGRLLLTESPSLASELDGLTHDDVSAVLPYTTNGYSYLEKIFFTCRSFKCLIISRTLAYK